jgi:hypothetical protein
MKVSFRITLDEEAHRDAIKALQSIPKPLRGEYIVEAIKCFRQHYLHATDHAKEGKKTRGFSHSIDL